MAITSPFKKLSHSREGSRDETSTQPNTHQRKSSKGKPVIQRGGSQTQQISGQGLHKKSNTVTSVSSTNSTNSTSLAQQYESDKQRLIKYCFSKHEPDGTLSESYITHVRLIEDSSYPSSKPPSTSNPSNKKHRILALAVQKDGTVRLHKGRENPNGSFQIGRTWSIAELSHLIREPTNDTGFIAKLRKNYYWETNSTKERQVFVTSLVRIYRKFTNGFVPFLINWDLSIFGLDEENYKMFIDKKWLERKESVASTTSIPRKQSTTSEVSLPKQQPQQHRPSVTKALETKPVSPKKTTDPSEYRSLSPPKRELPSYNDRKHQYASDASLNSRRPSEQSSGRNHSKPQLFATSTASSSGSKDHGLLPAVSTPQLAKKSSSSSSSIPKQPAPDLPVDDDQDSNATPDDLTREISQQLDSLALGGDSDIPERRDIDGIPIRKDTSLDSQLKPPSSGSAPRSAKDIEIVAHRKSMHEFEQDEEDEDEDEDDSDDDDGDITDMYQDAYGEKEEESKPEPFPGTQPTESEPFPGTERDFTPDESYENSFDTGVDSQEVIVQNTPATLKYHSDDGEDYDDLNEVPETPHLNIPKKTRGARSATVDSAISANIPGLESEGSSFDDIFDQINWETTDDSETLTLKLMKELADTEYGTTKNLIELKSQSSTLGNYTTKISEECDKLSPLLNFFAVELSGFARDIQHVETESQGLQVETINKKTLWNDLQQLLTTVSVDENSLKILLSSDIDQDLSQIETILADLQSAIVAIRGSDKYEEDLGDMRALRDRRNKYENVLSEFLKKVKYDLDYRFKYAVKRIGDEDDHSIISDQLSRLMVYSGLTLFTKEVSSETFYELVTIYESSANPLYKKIFEDYNSQLISSVHQQEKFSLVNVNAFNDVKSTKNHKNQHESKHDRLRQRFGLLDESNGSGSSVNLTAVSDDQTEALAIFNVFSKIQSLMTSQQDFISKFFHLLNEDTTLSHYIQLHPPHERPNLLNEKTSEIDFDRDNARDVFNSMSSVFQPAFDDLIKTVVQLLRDNQRITPSVILFLELFEKDVGGTNQDFLLNVFKRFIDRLKVDWLKFIENQVKIIDKSVLAHKKVREVSLIVKNFTSFVAEIEKSLIELLPGYVNIDTLEIRTIVNSSYEGLIRAILKNFENEEDEKTFARFKLHDDGDHKEKSNHNINLIQNSNWLIESLSPYKIVTLEQSFAILKTLFTTSRDHYVSYLVHEHFGKIADFVNDVEALVQESPKSIDPSKRNAYSRSTLNKVLSNYPHSEIAKTVTHLRATVIKHFDGTSNEIQRQLVEKIWSSLQAQFVSITLRLQNITEKYYRDVEPRFSKKDLIALFNAARV